MVRLSSIAHCPRALWWYVAGDPLPTAAMQWGTVQHEPNYLVTEDKTECS